MGIGRRNGRFGGLGQRVLEVLLCGGRFNLVLPAQPATEIDQFAAFAAKGPVRPFLRPLYVQRFFADWATYLFHRPPLFRTSLFSRTISSPPSWRSFWYRLYRSCRFSRAPLPACRPGRRSCRTRSGSRFDRIPSP